LFDEKVNFKDITGYYNLVVYKGLHIVIPFFSFPGLQEMGDIARAGAAVARLEHDPRPAVLSQLRPNLVWIDAAGGRSDQDPVRGPLAGIRPCPGATFEFARLRQRLQLPIGQHHESGGKVQRVVVRRYRRCFFLYIYIAYYIVYTYLYTQYEYCRSPAATNNFDGMR